MHVTTVPLEIPTGIALSCALTTVLLVINSLLLFSGAHCIASRKVSLTARGRFFIPRTRKNTPRMCVSIAFYFIQGENLQRRNCKHVDLYKKISDCVGGMSTGRQGLHTPWRIEGELVLENRENFYHIEPNEKNNIVYTVSVINCSTCATLCLSQALPFSLFFFLCPISHAFLLLIFFIL